MLRSCLLTLLGLPLLGAAQDGLRIESSEAGGRHTGEVYAVLELPFSRVRPALGEIERWCHILILPANVQRCAVGERLTVHIARRPTDPVADAYGVDFRYRLDAASADSLQLQLSADSGPLGTRDYRLRVAFAPLDPHRTFVHLSYSYALGLAARMAMQAYFATSGRDKVGFTVVERLPDGRPVRVGGARGAVERNAMRYYLAVEAYLESLELPAPRRLEARLRGWYEAIERHPQLREELGREEYLRIKRTQAALSRP